MAANHSSLLYLWDKRTLYIGDLLDLVTLTPASASLVVGLEKPFQFWTPHHGKVQTRVALIPAGKTLSLDHDDQPVACCYLDPFNADFNLLKTCMLQQADDVLFDSDRLEIFVRCFTQLFESEHSPRRAYQMLMQDVFPSVVLRELRQRHLSEIKKVVELIKRNPTSNISNRELATAVGLSESQLQRQFKSITGIPVRRYRLWHRLFVTATLMGFGMSLTDASLAAGFADSSHFNHTFKSMLGMKPSFVLKRREQIKIFIGGDNSYQDQTEHECGREQLGS